MLFNSYVFLLAFLPTVLAGTYLLNRKQHAIAILWVGLASLIFYAYWNTHHLIILISSVLINFWLGRCLARAQATHARKLLIIAGLIFNLSLLFVYKYLGFSIANINLLFGSSLATGNWVLPIGISFFTFTQISYLVDAYKKKIAAYSFPEYLLFVTFFPHLVAGPILRHHSVMPQLQSPKFGRPTARFAYIGLALFCCGLFKKVMIADNLSSMVGPLFASASHLSTAEAWCAALLYTMQIYYDFSGYSEMALGLGFLLNVRIPTNFNSPYRACSLIEFWRRWHISLSQFLRDYVYIPIGGSRKGRVRHLANLLLVMTLCGMWHGAGWTFIFWGIWHGTLLACNHLWRYTPLRLPAFLAWMITFLCVVVGWVWFRAHDMQEGWQIVSAMFMLHETPSIKAVLPPNTLSNASMALVFLIPWAALTPGVRYYVMRRNPSIGLMFLFAYMLILSLKNVANPTEFLYFQF